MLESEPGPPGLAGVLSCVLYGVRFGPESTKSFKKMLESEP